MIIAGKRHFKMDKKTLYYFIKEMKEAIYGAGEMALGYRGRVRNVKKETEELLNDSNFVKKQREAKTIIDEKIQEKLLLAASKLLNTWEVYVDAEEETSRKNLFSAKPTATTLVIDPIDGTLAYLLGRDCFSICVSLFENSEFLTAFVYFPARRDFYFFKDSAVYCEKGGELQKIAAPKNKNSNLIYVNNRVGEQITKNLITRGFQVINDADGVVVWPDALIKCIKGEYKACIFHSPQTRDVLLGAMISKMAGGYAYSWLGQPIVWPAGGRIPNVLFGFNPIPKDILLCLKQP